MNKMVAPLEEDGEVYLYVLPFPQEADRLDFTIEGLSAVADDGKEYPLPIRLSKLVGKDMRYQRLLASGRLAPGRYRGFTMKVSKAVLKTEEGTADLLVSKEPYPVTAPFTVDQKRAKVLSLTFKYPESVDKSFGYTPVFSVVLPEKPLTKLVGFASNSGSDDLTVFDKFTKQVVGVIPVGRDPVGMVTDQVLNRTYLALSGDDEVDVIDVTAGEFVNRIKLAVGDRPNELALTPDGKILLSVNTGSNTVSFIDPASFIELSRVGTGYEPVSILVDRQGMRAYTFNARSNDITIIDIPNRSAIGSVPTESDPLRGQLNKAGDRLYVIFAGSSYMAVYSLPTFSVINRVYLGLGMSSIKVDQATDLIYIGKKDEPRISVFDPFSFIPVDYIDAGGPVSYMTIDNENNNLVILMRESRTVAVVNLNNRNELSLFDVGDDPYYLTLMGERN